MTNLERVLDTVTNNVRELNFLLTADQSRMPKAISLQQYITGIPVLSSRLIEKLKANPVVNDAEDAEDYHYNLDLYYSKNASTESTASVQFYLPTLTKTTDHDHDVSTSHFQLVKARGTNFNTLTTIAAGDGSESHSFDLSVLNNDGAPLTTEAEFNSAFQRYIDSAITVRNAAQVQDFITEIETNSASEPPSGRDFFLRLQQIIANN